MTFEQKIRQWLTLFRYTFVSASTFDKCPNKHDYSDVVAISGDKEHQIFFVRTPYWFDKSDFYGEMPLPDVSPLQQLYNKSETRNVVWFNSAYQSAIAIKDDVWKYFSFNEEIGRRCFHTDDASFMELPEKMWCKAKARVEEPPASA